MEHVKEIVRKGYDALSTQYRAQFKSSHENDYPRWTDAFKALLPAHGAVLELGCGDGIPVAQLLAADYSYTGIDLSPVQATNARKHVPHATFIVSDMASLQYPSGSFDGIIALYSIIHVPLNEQEQLFRSIFRWLKPGGCFLCTVGVEAWTGTEENWITRGTTMYWSHAAVEQYLTWAEAIGFTLIKKEHMAENETATHALLLLQKAVTHQE